MAVHRRCIAALVLVIVAASCDCGTPRPFDTEKISSEGDQTAARIAFSYPQVFSRESLINDRLKEGLFLEDMLSKSGEAQFQSQLRRDLTMISSLAGQLGISFDSATKLGLDRSEALDDISSQIEMTRLRAELQRLQEQYQTLQSGTGAGLMPPSGTATSASQNGDAGAPKAQLDEIVPRVKEALDKLAEIAKNRLRSATEVQSPEDHFRDLQAYRAQLRGARNTAKLDDTHDRDGNALYRMQFTATVFPGTAETQRRWGIARVEVAPPFLSKADVDRLYLRWLAHSTSRLNVVNHHGAIETDDQYVRLTSDNRLIGLVSLKPEVFKAGQNRSATMWIAVHPDLTFEIKELMLRKDELSAWYNELADFFQEYPTVAHLKNPSRSHWSSAIKRKAPAVADEKRRVAQNEKLRLALQEVLGDGCPFLNPRDTSPWNRYRDFFAIANTLARDNPFLQAGLQGITQVEQERGRVLHIDKANRGASIVLLDDIASVAADSLWLITQLYLLAGEACDEPRKELAERVLDVPVPESFDRAVRRYDEDKSCQNVAAFMAAEPSSESPPRKPSKLRACGAPVVYTIAPIEEAQRMSSVAGAANSAQMALALAGALPRSGVDARAGVGHLQSAVGNAEAVERLPLVVGFSEQIPKATAPTEMGLGTPTSRFGWVFGPQAYVETTGKPRIALRHVVSTHQLAVDVSVPVWWPKFDLSVATAWVGNTWTSTKDVLDQGTEGAAVKVKMGASMHSQGLEVNRPLSIGDLDTLTAYLLRAFPPYGLRPVRIDRVEPESIALCKTDSDVSLLIYGLNLWRNPDVYLLGQKAMNVHVMPDMQGISADFKLKGGHMAVDASRSLVVWTQSGPTEHPVKLKSDGEGCPDNPAVTSKHSRSQRRISK